MFGRSRKRAAAPPPPTPEWLAPPGPSAPPEADSGHLAAIGLSPEALAAPTPVLADGEARLASAFADPDRVFLAGMLHDVGKAIALRSLAAVVRDGGAEVHDGAAVDRVLQHVHVAVGREAHREWGLPAHVADVAARHHAADLGAGEVEVHLVRLVSALRLVRAQPALHPQAPREIVESARALGLDPVALGDLDAQLPEFEDWVRMMFGEAAGGPATAG